MVAARDSLRRSPLEDAECASRAVLDEVYHAFCGASDFADPVVLQADGIGWIGRWLLAYKRPLLTRGDNWRLLSGKRF